MSDVLNGAVAGPEGMTAAPSGEVAGARHPVAEPTMATLLGEVVWLLTQSPTHRHLFLADLEWAVMPALMLRQVHLFRSKGRVVGVALWASVSDEVDARLSSGVTRLAPLEWKSGDTLWLVDIIAPFGGTERILEELGRSVLDGEKVKYWSVNKNGQKTVSNIISNDRNA